MKNERTIRKIQMSGKSSLGITMPMPFVREHGIVEGDYVEVICEGETLLVKLLEKPNPSKAGKSKGKKQFAFGDQY